MIRILIAIALTSSVCAQTLSPEVQSTIAKAQAALQQVQTELAKISPAVPPAPPAVAESRKAEVVPHVLVRKSYRTELGLVGTDDPVQVFFMRLPKEEVIPENLKGTPVTPEVQKWLLATRPATQATGGMFDDPDGNGRLTFEEYAQGSKENPLMCGWVSQSDHVTIQISELVNSGVSHVIESGDGKTSWHTATQGVDYKPSDLTGTGRFEYVTNTAGGQVKMRVLESLHALKSGKGFLRVRLSKEFSN